MFWTENFWTPGFWTPNFWTSGGELPPDLVAGVAVASGSDEKVALSATAPTGGTSPYTYQWYRSDDGSKGSAIVGATDLTYEDTGLVNGTTYYYTLDATDDAAATVSYTQVAATPRAPGNSGNNRRRRISSWRGR